MQNECAVSLVHPDLYLPCHPVPHLWLFACHFPLADPLQSDHQGPLSISFDNVPLCRVKQSHTLGFILDSSRSFCHQILPLFPSPHQLDVNLPLSCFGKILGPCSNNHPFQLLQPSPFFPSIITFLFRCQNHFSLLPQTIGKALFTSLHWLPMYSASSTKAFKAFYGLAFPYQEFLLPRTYCPLHHHTLIMFS